eukprot:TRINITY_DN18889_c0_g1_i1.p1 TRINITY_DN18889_c0_g1~~TRINITY_DN18889_c0_g1_i1.p1  ORF type:complete len:153 (+),score=6.56 TRINITY_DN18889_c0_g1_i1:62-460(+)
MAAQKATSFLSNLTKSLRIKPPWKITGPAAGQEYLESVPDAGEYRKWGPGTAPKRVYIPHSEPDHVYNIKYYERDSRRQPRTRSIVQFDPKEMAAIEAEKAELPPTPGRYYGETWGRRVPLNDVGTDEGYTH